MTPDAAGFLRDRRVMVFGAGYIGGAVVAAARAAGAHVGALTRNPARARELAALGAEIVVADLAEPATWSHRLPTAVDFVLNCVSSGGGGLAGYQRSYGDGARAILEWGQSQQSAGALVYTSSTSVYAQGEGAQVDEDAPATAADERAAVLLQAEELALRWPGPPTVLRLVGLYGPARHYLLDTMRAGAATVPGHGEHRLNLIHRDDVVAAVLAAWREPERAAGEIFNVADDGAAPKADVVAWLAGRLGTAPPTFSGAVTPGRRSVVPDRVIRNDKIKRVLGWRPIYPTYREGYASFI